MVASLTLIQFVVFFLLLELPLGLPFLLVLSCELFLDDADLVRLERVILVNRPEHLAALLLVLLEPVREATALVLAGQVDV